MEWNNYFNLLSKQYRIKINKELQNIIKEYFGEDLNIYTEQDMYEHSRKIIQNNYKYKSNRKFD